MLPGLRQCLKLHLEWHGSTPHTGYRGKTHDLARRTNRGSDELLEQAVEHLVSYNESLERKVRDSQAAVKRGETLSNDEVRACLESRERR